MTQQIALKKELNNALVSPICNALFNGKVFSFEDNDDWKQVDTLDMPIAMKADIISKRNDYLYIIVDPIEVGIEAEQLAHVLNAIGLFDTDDYAGICCLNDFLADDEVCETLYLKDKQILYDVRNRFDNAIVPADDIDCIDCNSSRLLIKYNHELPKDALNKAKRLKELEFITATAEIVMSILMPQLARVNDVSSMDNELEASDYVMFHLFANSNEIFHLMSNGHTNKYDDISSKEHKMRKNMPFIRLYNDALTEYDKKIQEAYHIGDIWNNVLDKTYEDRNGFLVEFEKIISSENNEKRNIELIKKTLKDIGDNIGINAIIEAYYKGVPYEDLIDIQN